MFSPVKGKLIDRVNIPGKNATRISLRDDTIKCTDWRTNTIYCYTLTGQQIWTFKDENVLVFCIARMARRFMLKSVPQHL
jgi:outer membrane protein assembly factor BamB